MKNDGISNKEVLKVVTPTVSSLMGPLHKPSISHAFLTRYSYGNTIGICWKRLIIVASKFKDGLIHTYLFQQDCLRFLFIFAGDELG